MSVRCRGRVCVGGTVLRWRVRFAPGSSPPPFPAALESPSMIRVEGVSLDNWRERNKLNNLATGRIEEQFWLRPSSFGDDINDSYSFESYGTGWIPQYDPPNCIRGPLSTGTIQAKERATLPRLLVVTVAANRIWTKKYF